MTRNRFARTTGLAALLVGMLLAPACAPVRVSSYAAPKTDVRSYGTYAWETGELGQTGDPRLDNNSFFRERVQSATDAQLGFRGYQRVGAGGSDMILHIHARVEQRIDSSQIDRDSGRCQVDECRSYVYDEGTLLIDLIDARTNALIWRGWAERSLDGVVDNQASMNQAIDRAVRSIFERLPARQLSGGRPRLARTN